MSEFRELQSTTGEVRTEMWNGREHLVVPVVALMEGVIHAINAQTPEFVSAAALSKKPNHWNGHPLVLGHPVRDGKQISAHEAAVLEKHAFGHVRAAHMNGSRLGVEALIDPSRLEQLGQQQLLNDLRAGKSIEVSVGAFVTTNGKSGEYNGKPYKSEWVDIMPDHLAFLPNGRGACSIEMGCGTHRMAEALMPEEIELETLGGPGSGPRKGGGGGTELGSWSKHEGHVPGAVARGTPGPSTKDRWEGRKKTSPNFDPKDTVRIADIIRKSNGSKTKQISLASQMAKSIDKPDKALRRSNAAVDQGHVHLAEIFHSRYEELTSGRRAAADAEISDSACRMCDGVGYVDGDPCSECDEELKSLNTQFDEFRAAIGARNSASDLATIQAMHDYATKLGATCDSQNTRFMASKDCPACDGSGNKDGNPCDVCDGTGELKAAAEGDDMAELKTAASLAQLADKIKTSFGKFTVEDAIKDNDLSPEDASKLKDLVKPKSKTDGKFNFDKLKGAEAQPCGCGGDRKMTPEQRAEMISTLIACEYSGFADGDQAMLEVASDERLESLKTAFEARMKAAAEQPKVEEIKGEVLEVKAAEAAPLTEEDFMKLAPQSLRSLIERQQKQDIDDKAAFVTSLKAAQDEYSEKELVAMPLEQLRRLSRVAKVTEVSFEGRGVPRQLATKEDVYANPPNPYEAGLEKLRAAQAN